MKRLQGLVTGVSGLALIAAFATPTFAAKTVIADEEMDEMTAAGEPKVAQASTVVGDAYAKNKQLNVIANHIDGQFELTALTLNNIFGENQIANGTNIQSGGSGNSGDQDNTIVQSWGSGKAHKAVKVEGKPGSPGGAGGVVVNGHGLINKGVAAGGGDGGDASQGVIGILWEFGDEIADASSVVGNAKAKNEVHTIIAAAINEGSQENLTALTVNNIFGFNQVANGLNISSGSIGPDADGNGAINNSGTVGTNQANDVSQFRGSPNNWWSAKTFSNQ